MHWFQVLLQNESQRSFRASREIALMVGFLFIALSLFALGMDNRWLRPAAPAMIWSIVLLSSLLMIEQIFQQDRDNGRLELLLSQPIPRWIIVLAKICGFWLRTGLPMLLCAPLYALMLQLPLTILPVLLTSLFLGTGALSCFATIGAALSLGARQPIMLVMVLILPIQIPVLIFGVYSLEHALLGLETFGSLLWLGVCLLLSMTCIPFGAAALHREVFTAELDD